MWTTPLHFKILTMLAGGAKDETVARSLALGANLPATTLPRFSPV